MPHSLRLGAEKQAPLSCEKNHFVTFERDRELSHNTVECETPLNHFQLCKTKPSVSLKDA